MERAGAVIHTAGYLSGGENIMNQGRHHQPEKFVMDLNLNEQTEDQLIERGLSGDARALDVLFSRNTRALYQTALRVLGNPEDAEEALQEGLLSAYRNLPRFERRSQFSTWLTRIVINAALMRRRSKRSRPAVSLDDVASEGELPLAERFADESPNPEQIYAGTELGDRVKKKLAEISPLLRTAFWLREIEGLSAEEAAHVLGVSRNTLKARLWRARQELAARLGLALDGNLAPAT
jgi:RNA polymerase sigma-70 factor (ECF subfamily)